MPGVCVVRLKAIHSETHAVSGANVHTGLGFRFAQHTGPTWNQQLPLFEGPVTRAMLSGWRKSRVTEFADLCVLTLGMDMRPDAEDGWRGCVFENVIVAYRAPVNQTIWSFSARELLGRTVAQVEDELDLTQPATVRVLDDAAELRRKYGA
ncbi:MAG: hypothetical protein AAGI53_15970 [Planctomycetota bacterium]